MDVPSSLMNLGEGVEITCDPGVIELESEKNGRPQFAAVDLVLRPAFAEAWKDSVRPFSIVSIETRAGCNYQCSFCPVSRSVDPRTPGEMSLELIEKIAHELAELRFDGRVCLFGNNEPLLDARLTQIIYLFRSSCPASDLRVLTNGTYAKADVVVALFKAGLSTLVINNYTDGLRLISPVRALIQMADTLAPYDIRVSVRSRTAVLTTRAGLAPNKPVPDPTPQGFCALPFTDVYIGYRGNVNLCCFDAHGSVSMGDVAESSIAEIWASGAFQVYRRSLLRSARNGLTLCESCDYDGFRDFSLHKTAPITRRDLEMRLGQ
jgi:MoaA/NifB/PqqE/SkfB family radical SAM enzyme